MRSFKNYHLLPIILLNWILVAGIAQGEIVVDTTPDFPTDDRASAFQPLLERAESTCNKENQGCGDNHDGPCCPTLICQYLGEDDEYVEITDGTCQKCIPIGTPCSPKGYEDICCRNESRCYQREDKTPVCEPCQKEGSVCKERSECCYENSEGVDLYCRVDLGLLDLLSKKTKKCQPCVPKGQRCDVREDCCRPALCSPQIINGIETSICYWPYGQQSENL